MPDKKETRSSPLGMRITPTVRAALEKAAADDSRTLAAYVEKLLTDHLRAKGYLKVDG